MISVAGADATNGQTPHTLPRTRIAPQFYGPADPTMTPENDRHQPAIDRINELWGTHEYGDRTAGVDTRCLAFFVDTRFVRTDGAECKYRLAVSYGDNPFTPEMGGGFVPPPILHGSHVFGIHTVGTWGDRITMFDHWCDAREATGRETPAEVERLAREILAGIPDAKYARLAGSGRPGAAVFRSPDRPIGSFEIMPGEPL